MVSISQTYLMGELPAVPRTVLDGLSAADAQAVEAIYQRLDLLVARHNRGHVMGNIGLTFGILFDGFLLLQSHSLLGWWVGWQLLAVIALLTVLAGCRFVGWYVGQSLDCDVVMEVRDDLLDELENDGGDTARLLRHIQEKDHRPGYMPVIRRLYQQANETYVRSL